MSPDEMKQLFETLQSIDHSLKWIHWILIGWSIAGLGIVITAFWM